MKAAELAHSAGKSPHCCDETAGVMKIHRFFRKFGRVDKSDLPDNRDSCELDLVSALIQASISCCGKDGTGTRHIEALFSMMRMLGLRLLFSLLRTLSSTWVLNLWGMLTIYRLNSPQSNYLTCPCPSAP